MKNKERQLWQAVILQAFKDASVKNPKSDDKIKNKKNAIKWLIDKESTLNIVCDFAGFEVEYTRRKVASLITC